MHPLCDGLAGVHRRSAHLDVAGRVLLPPQKSRPGHRLADEVGELSFSKKKVAVDHESPRIALGGRNLADFVTSCGGGLISFAGNPLAERQKPADRGARPRVGKREL